MKTRKSFEELVTWAEAYALKELIRGDFHNAMWLVCTAVAKWESEQKDKRRIS